MMNQLVIERLQQKSVSASLVERLQDDFNLAPLVARTLSEEMSRYFERCYQDKVGTGQLMYLAVSREAPAGRPLSKCKRLPVKLSLNTDEDLMAMKQSMATLRQGRIQRLTEEAYEQGALLTHEDLSYLLSSSLATIKRDVKALRQRGLMIPTRGQIKDIGKGVSHKRQIVQDYLAGYTFTEIERRQRHSVRAIHRYCRDFSRVVRLESKGFPKAEISRVTGLSERLVEQYQSLYAACDPANERLALLLAETETIPDTPVKIKRGVWLQ
jgi:hypothetical protein